MYLVDPHRLLLIKNFFNMYPHIFSFSGETGKENIISDKLRDIPFYKWNFGTYTSGFSDQNRYVKFCKLFNFDEHFNLTVPKEIKSLLKMNEPDVITHYSIKRTVNYNILHTYLKDNLVKLKSREIGNIPTKVIVSKQSQKLYNMNIPKSINELIPVKEKGIIEIYESFNEYNKLSGIKYEGLVQIYRGNSIKLLMKYIKKLFTHEGLMLDLYEDYPIFEACNEVKIKPKSINNCSEMLYQYPRYLPRFKNLVLIGDKIKIYDTFPLYIASNRPTAKVNMYLKIIDTYINI